MFRLTFLLVALCAGFACSEDVRLGRNQGSSVRVPEPDSGAGLSPGVSGGGTSGFPLDVPPDATPVPVPAPVAAPGVCEPVRCGGGQPEECGDCIDNDRDGRSDADDPECLGPCDNSELELFSGVSVRVNPSCRADCYFDLNAGSGDDGCNWSFRCDPLQPLVEQGCGFSATQNNCALDGNRADACRAACLPLVPNGCDCFGCCELPAGSGSFIFIGSESAERAHCELATSTDPALCRPCTPVSECQNDCAECELCVGKPTLPASCAAAGSSTPSCPDGATPCDPSTSGACGPVHYCITGCCVPLPR